MVKVLTEIYNDTAALSYLFLGTDNLEEIAYLISLTAPVNKSVILSGAMRSLGCQDYDGLENYSNSMLIDPTLFRGISGSWVCIAGSLFAGNQVRKSHSNKLTAFSSEDGPIAEICAGQNWKFCRPVVSNSQAYNLENLNLELKIPIVTISLLSELDFIDAAKIDGLIVAGAGTGTISSKARSNLSKIAKFKPVVVSTRCYAGPNYDEDMYPGSLSSYENDGFILRGYENLNPLQARLALIVEMSVGE